MNGAVVKPMPVCLRNKKDMGWTKYHITWCGIVYQEGSFSSVTTNYEHMTCEYCSEEHALGLLADLP